MSLSKSNLEDLTKQSVDVVKAQENIADMILTVATHNVMC